MIDNRLNIKKELFNSCIRSLKNRIANAKTAMDDAQNAAKNEEKSTAGDKYDTSRAMSHNLRDMNAKQLEEALKDLSILEKINPDILLTEVRSGAVVYSTMGNYFISASTGDIKLENEKYFAISPLSPIGQILLGRKRNEEFIFRDKKAIITELF